MNPEPTQPGIDCFFDDHKLLKMKKTIMPPAPFFCSGNFGMHKSGDIMDYNSPIRNTL